MCRSKYKIKNVKWINRDGKIRSRLLKICIRIDWKKDSFVVGLINDNLAEPSILFREGLTHASHPDISKSSGGNKARVKQL